MQYFFSRVFRHRQRLQKRYEKTFYVPISRFWINYEANAFHLWTLSNMNLFLKVENLTQILSDDILYFLQKYYTIKEPGMKF